MLMLFWRQAKDALHIASGVENPDDLQGLGFVPIDDQVRIDQKEPVPLVGQFVAPMADAGVLRQLDHGVVQRVKNPVGSFDVVVGDVVPDVVDILPGARREDESLHPLPRFRPALRRRISANVSAPSTNSPRSAWSLPMAISLRSSASRTCFKSSRSFRSLSPSRTTSLCVWYMPVLSNSAMKLSNAVPRLTFIPAL